MGNNTTFFDGKTIINNIFKKNQCMKQKAFYILPLVGFIVIAVFSCKSKQSATTQNKQEPSVTYTNTMKAVIDTKCAGCHMEGKKAAKAGVYTSYALMKNELNHMYHEAIVEKKMPPTKATQLTDEEIANWNKWKENNFAE